MIHVVTLFAQNYMSRGIAMLESIRKNSNTKIIFTVLAMDEATYKYMKSFESKNVTILNLEEFPDKEFQILKDIRPFRELCWTAASCITNYVFYTDKMSEFIIYVDADCYFFNDISKMCSSWKQNSNIFVHEHRYSSNRKDWEKTAGRFNVGVVGFRANSKEAGACISRWRYQVLEICELNPELGFCGDQGYLNEWPNLYLGLQIMISPGEGAAPWNIEYLNSKRNKETLFISGEELIFYHFHALKMTYISCLNLMYTHLAYGYEIPASVKSLVYRPYLRHVRKINKELKKTGFSLESIGLEEKGFQYLLNGGNPEQRIVQLLT